MATIFQMKSVQSLSPGFALLILACGAGDHLATTSTTDSLGVAIVVSNGAAWPDGAGARLEDRPYVHMDGSGEAGPPLYQIAGAIRLANGRIAVASRGEHRLHFYDHSGGFISTSGRAGDGPGEFRSIQWVRRYVADSLLVYDSRSETLSVFDTYGKFARQLRLDNPNADGFAVPVGAFSDGTFVGRLPNPERSRRIATAAFRDSSQYVRYAADGTLLGEVGVFPNDDVFLLVEPHAGHHLLRLFIAPPFARRTLVSVHDDEMFVNDGGDADIRVYSASGVLKRVLRPPFAPNPLHAGDIEAYRQASLASAKSDEGRRSIEQRLAAVSFPDKIPPYWRISVSADRRVWAADYARPGVDKFRWRVFDPEGRLLGSIDTPDRFVPLDIGGDYVLGYWLEPETDVEHVRMYRIVERR